MKLIDYLKKSLRKKKARRVTQEYPFKVDTYHFDIEGKIEFANWENPLVKAFFPTQDMVDFFKKFIKKGDLAIDIGANIGDTTVPMALAAGKEGLTLAFDPNPFVYKGLEKNSSLNTEKQNIIPFRYAITIKDEAFFYVSSEASFANGGISTTENSRHGKYVFPEKITGINLQVFLESNYREWLDRLTFIKIDVEGYDKEIIKSISELLRKYKPVVVAESFGPGTISDKEELYHVLSSIGYEIYYFEDFLSKAKVVKLNSAGELSSWKKTVNIFAIQK